MSVKLGGVVPIRNGFKLDFCFENCIKSLLPICDTVAVSVGEGDDDTEKFLREWWTREPKLSLNVWPWPHPKGNPDWYTDWLNYARQHTPCDWIIQLDADEVLHEKSYQEVLDFVNAGKRRSAVCTRWNFWKDHKHTIPEGFCCGKRVIRIQPQNVWLPSDGYHPLGAETSQMAVETGIEVFHYGFIRKRECFFEKEKLLQGYFFDSWDARLEKAKTHEGNWMTMPGVTSWEDRLDPFGGTHPALMKEWLKERGME